MTIDKCRGFYARVSHIYNKKNILIFIYITMFSFYIILYPLSFSSLSRAYDIIVSKRNAQSPGKRIDN